MSTPKRPKRPRDINQLAYELVQESVAEKPPRSAVQAAGVAPKKPESDPTPRVKKNPHAVALSKLGAKKGGLARASKLTAKQRSESARKAARARWAKKREAEI